MDDTGMVVEEVVGAKSSTVRSPSATPSPPPSPNPNLFSSDAPNARSASPPSSPPPRAASPEREPQEPMPPTLKRKRSFAEETSSLQPLSDITRKNASQPLVGQPAKKARLTQMKIDLGGDVSKTCKKCGMEYVPSNAEDAALHKEFHAGSINGLEVGKVAMRELLSADRLVSDVKGTGKGNGEREVIVVIDGKSSQRMKNLAKRALGLVNTDLSAVEIEDDTLWGKISIKPDSKVRGRKKKASSGNQPNSVAEENQGRFKVYLYLVANKCTGLCLAEKIDKAYEVIDSNNVNKRPDKQVMTMARSSSYVAVSVATTAILGVSRIWTSKSHRGKGFGPALLDAARHNFLYGMEVPKEMVAFSQPTESGGRLAERWFGRSRGWHVYFGG